MLIITEAGTAELIEALYAIERAIIFAGVISVTNALGIIAAICSLRRPRK